jgi:hypothetical protein
VKYEDTKLFKRGSNFFKYEVVATNCGATYNQVEKCVKFLKEAGDVATRKSTRGIVISVLKYDKYQSLDNYKSGTEIGTEAKSERNKSDTITKETNNITNNTSLGNDGVSHSTSSIDQDSVAVSPPPSSAKPPSDVSKVFDLYEEISKRTIRKRSIYVNKAKSALKDFTVEEIRKAFAAMSFDKWITGDNPGGVIYFTIEYALRKNKIEHYLNTYIENT